MTPLESYENKILRIHKLVHGMIAGNLNGIVIAGSPGIGKSYNVLKALEAYGDKINVTEIKGHITPFSLFTTLLNNCKENDVILLDDADSAFLDIGALNLLKAACDTMPTRTVTWLSSANLGEQSFQFKGKVVILTNVSIKKSQHHKAMMDRFICYDPDITIEEKLHKIRAIAADSNHIEPEIGDSVIKFLFCHQDRLEEISLRTFIKTAQLAKSLGKDWEDIAEHVMLSN